MALKCPRTQSPLKEITMDGIKIDISEKCGGVWLDNYELKKLDEAQETAGDNLVEHLEAYVDAKIDLSKRINCPKCVNSVMMRNFYSPKRAIQIDTCPTCNGVWLDPGELTHLRKLFKTEEEKNAYAKAFVDEVTKEAMASEKARTAKEQEQAHNFANALRFICPSYYIKGKQNWGAF